MANQEDVSDRIFSVSGTLSYVLVKDDEIYLVVGDWARSLASTKMPVEGGVYYNTHRHGSIAIFGPEVPSWWNEWQLVELPMSYFEVSSRPIGQAGYTVNRVNHLQLSAC